MTADTDDVLEAMVERSAALSGNTADSDSDSDEREIPPNVFVTPDDERFEDLSVGIGWMGVRLCSIAHFEDEDTKAAISSFVDAREHLRVQNRPDYEYTVEVTRDRVEPATVVDLTERILQEIYSLSLSDRIELEWDDISTGERLTADEFVAKYGT